jgi:hypothetical protein
MEKRLNENLAVIGFAALNFKNILVFIVVLANQEKDWEQKIQLIFLMK